MDAETRKCRCGAELEKAELQVFSILTPRESFSCVACGDALAVFTVIDTVIEQPDLEVWLKDWSMAEPFSEFVTRKLAERLYN